MRARHTEEKKLVRGELLARKRGDVCCSLSYLAKEWGWSREKVRRFMAMLESDGMITLHATTHDTTITIENYDKYQFKRTLQQTLQQTRHKEIMIINVLIKGERGTLASQPTDEKERYCSQTKSTKL